jgi:hypothetical protein
MYFFFAPIVVWPIAALIWFLTHRVDETDSDVWEEYGEEERPGGAGEVLEEA